MLFKYVVLQPGSTTTRKLNLMWLRWNPPACVSPGSLQSLRLRLKDLVRDMLMGCLSEGPSSEARPEGCEVDEVGPMPGRFS